MIYTILSLLVLAVAYVWVLSPLGTSDRVGITTAISMVALVILTSIYAWHTRKMANEIRKQRYAESLPLLVPHIPPTWNTEEMEPNDIPYEFLASGVGVKVLWCNVGKGVAINLRFSFWSAPTSTGKANFFPPSESGTLEVGGKNEVDYGKILNEGQLKDLSEAYHPHLLAEYQDIYERIITTVQRFRIDEQNRRAFLGELYFEVNNKRLGQEVSA